jgi:phage terminase large subunit-like protein
MSMSPPSKALERMVLSHGMDHAGHPVAQWMAANVALHRDHNDNMMPSKVRSAEKIDGIAAAVTAIGMSLKPAEENLIPNVEAA